MNFERAVSSDSFIDYFEYLKTELNKRSIIHLGTNNSKTSESIVKFVTLLGMLNQQLKIKTCTNLLVFLEFIDFKNNSHEPELRKCFLTIKGEDKRDVALARQRALEIWGLVIEKSNKIISAILSQQQL